MQCIVGAKPSPACSLRYIMNYSWTYVWVHYEIFMEHMYEYVGTTTWHSAPAESPNNSKYSQFPNIKGRSHFKPHPLPTVCTWACSSFIRKIRVVTCTNSGSEFSIAFSSCSLKSTHFILQHSRDTAPCSIMEEATFYLLVWLMKKDPDFILGLDD